MNQNLPTISSEKAGEIMEAVIARGDLAQLSPVERAKYYTRVCESIGLNPLTKPFEYITLNGKLTLYARKDATDQLRRHYGVSVVEMTDAMHEGITIVTVKVRDATGRTDMAKGAVTLKGLQGEALANAIMKAETKAKRRATLSICGLGFFDESEIDEEMPTDVKRYTKTKQAAKELFSALQAEVHLLTSAMQAKAWLEQSAERMKLLPRDWEDFLRTSCEELIRSDEPTEVWDDDDIPAPDHADGSAWDALGPVKQAGVLCSDESFWKFLTESLMNVGCRVLNKEGAADYVRFYCGEIKSRADLATNEAAAKKWQRLVTDYRAWQREPEIVPVSAQVGTRAPETSVAPTASPGGAADDKTAMDWDLDLGEASTRGSAALKAVWERMPIEHKKTCEVALRRRHQPMAEEADARIPT
jgi:hypothetical protein